jgi:hypothetical protein
MRERERGGLVPDAQVRLLQRFGPAAQLQKFRANNMRAVWFRATDSVVYQLEYRRAEHRVQTGVAIFFDT